MQAISPLPEAIDGRPWAIAFGPPGSGSMDPTARRMVVPPGTDPSSRFIRSHELAHSKITPRIAAYKQCIKHGVSMDALQCCEDLRVHHFLDHVGVECTGSLSDTEAEQVVDNLVGSMRSLAATMVSSRRTKDWVKLRAAVQRRLDPSAWQALLSSIRLIDKRLQAGKGMYRPIGMRNCTAPAARLFDALFFENADPAQLHDTQLPLKDMGLPRGKTRWGTMTIESVPISQSKKTLAHSRMNIYRDEGSVLKAAYRLPVDGRVFCRTRRYKGGTVLVDVSGSMHFTTEDLERIVASAPATTVAVYSGRGKAGVLTVVAQKGRMATASSLRLAQSHGNGNIIDGPALGWLSTQPIPRIWVSDGMVTGVGDQNSIDLGADAQLICRKGKIRRVDKAAAACQVLRA